MVSSATIMYSFGQVYSMADYLSEDQSYILTYPEGTVFDSCKSSIEKSGKIRVLPLLLVISRNSRRRCRLW